MDYQYPAIALWNQRKQLAQHRDRWEWLIEAVDRTSDFSPFQWIQIAAICLDYRPQLIIELGRGMGNSTACFLEAANQLGGQDACRVVSLCRRVQWKTVTSKRLAERCSKSWFAAGKIWQGNILRYNLTQDLRDIERCIVLWDAHGFEVAEWVLGHLMPKLAEKEHIVIMHDVMDATKAPRQYADSSLWKGNNAEGSSGFFLGPVFARVAQAISILDFAYRNEMPFFVADDAIRDFIAAEPKKLAELQELLGPEMANPLALWSWFTMNLAQRPLTFPKFKDFPSEQNSNLATWAGRARDRLKIMVK